jgi:hypothetical protein
MPNPRSATHSREMTKFLFGEPCTLLVFIDDATSRLMQLRFVACESTDSYFSALQGYFERSRLPCRFLLG